MFRSPHSRFQTTVWHVPVPVRVPVRRTSVAVFGVVGALMSGGVAVGPAASGSPAHVQSFQHGSPFALHFEQTWGGYAVTGADPYTSISGGWTVPTLDCSKGDGFVSPWLGIDGWSDATVEQIGIDMDCKDGAPKYRPWVEMYPAASNYFRKPVEAGDQMTASVAVAGSAWTISESDATQGWTKTFTFDQQDKLLSAEAILEALGRRNPPVNDFGAVTFTDLQVDGVPMGSAGTAHRTTLTRGHTKLSKESTLDGDTYTITWLHR